MKIGYARVSTADQKLSLQTDALKSEGCEKVYSEKISGKTKDRPELEKMLEGLRKGDEVVVWKLDRLGRSLKDLITLVGLINGKGCGFKSVKEQIDTTTAQGKLFFHIFGSLAEFERDIIRERTMAGLAAARARGRKGGRPKGLSAEAEKTAMAVETLYKERELTVKEICQKFRISRDTVYRYLKVRGVEIGK